MGLFGSSFHILSIFPSFFVMPIERGNHTPALSCYPWPVCYIPEPMKGAGVCTSVATHRDPS